jgi:phosphoglycolate phosphatase-like HAD superfamily hydrolase
MTNRPYAVIFDMDGTLCDVTSIRHHVLAKPKNFDAFHYGSIWCPPIDWVAAEAENCAANGYANIVVTAREQKWGTLTTNWLRHHAIPYDELHMRATGDIRPDTVIKGEILARLQERYEIRHAYDDNPAIIKLWTSHGITTTIVPGWADATV